MGKKNKKKNHKNENRFNFMTMDDWDFNDTDVYEDNINNTNNLVEEPKKIVKEESSSIDTVEESSSIYSEEEQNSKDDAKDIFKDDEEENPIFINDFEEESILEHNGEDENSMDIQVENFKDDEEQNPIFVNALEEESNSIQNEEEHSSKNDIEENSFMKSEDDTSTITDVEDEKTNTIELEKENIEKAPRPTSTKDAKDKAKKGFYFGFEARLATLIIFIILTFGVGGFLALKAINFNFNKKVSYDEVSTVDYSVCLTQQNDHYRDNCLRENMEYITSLVDNIKATFQYNVNVSTNINYDLYYRVVAISKIYDNDNNGNLLYQNEETLVDKTRLKDNSSRISLTKNIEIDYLKYNQMLANYNNNYMLNTTGSLEIVLYLDEPTETRSLAKMSMPLGTETITIKKESLTNNDREVEISKEEWNDTNSIYAVIASILIVISLILIFKATRLVMKVANNRSKYQMELAQLLRQYDRLIVIARDGYESNVVKEEIKLEEFEDLLDIRDELSKPIIYSKVNDIKSEFIVEDDDKLYKYVLKESDL